MIEMDGLRGRDDNESTGLTTKSGGVGVMLRSWVSGSGANDRLAIFSRRSSAGDLTAGGGPGRG